MDRTAAPWLIVTTHTPMYTSVGRHYVGGECFRQVYEDIFYAAKVRRGEGVGHG